MRVNLALTSNEPAQFSKKKLNYCSETTQSSVSFENVAHNNTETFKVNWNCLFVPDARRTLLRFHYVRLTRLLATTAAFFRFARILNGCRWNLAEVITATNRWTDYILGETVPGTREQDMTRNSNWRKTGACYIANDFTNFELHCASAGLASPLHTCTGESIIWPHVVFSSQCNTGRLSIPWATSAKYCHWAWICRCFLLRKIRIRTL